jgi:hypothetical protein
MDFTVGLDFTENIRIMGRSPCGQTPARKLVVEMALSRSVP